MDVDIDRNWFLTWVPYGTRLPGDERGFVSYHRPKPGERVIHNEVGTPLAANMPALHRHSREQLRADPISLTCQQADILLAQFLETTSYRQWHLWAVAIMADHIHATVGVAGDPDPAKILGDFKRYGSRALNRRCGPPVSDTWWAKGGSKRKLSDDDSLLCSIQYILDQDHPLLIWTAPVPELDLSGGRRAGRC